MKSQSLKLFAIAFVLGLVTIFASANSANAQSKLVFDAPFDFHVGKDKLSAGKYELKKLSYGRYVLKNTDTKIVRIIVFAIMGRNTVSSDAERVVFNRYGETYFLNSIFDKGSVSGLQIIRSNYEQQVNKRTENQLADKKANPTKVSINFSK